MHTLGVIGQILIGFFFIFMGLYNVKNRNQLRESLKKFSFAVPEWALFGTVGLEILAGIMIAFHFFTWIAAVYLIIFTVVVSFLLHPFWAAQGGERWKHLLVMANNIAIIGGLFLVLTIHH